MKILALLLLLPFQAQAISAFTVVSQRTIPAAQGSQKKIPLEIYVESKSWWETAGVVENTITRTNAVLNQCNLAVGQVKVTSIVLSSEVKQELKSEDANKGPNVRSLAAAVAQAPRPLAFLIDRKSGPQDMAKAYNKNGTDYQVGQHGDVMRSLLNTFYVSTKFVDNSEVQGAKASYNTFAHELVHVLGNIGHIKVNDNLMTEYDVKSGKLVKSQCEAIAKFRPKRK